MKTSLHNFKQPAPENRTYPARYRISGATLLNNTDLLKRPHGEVHRAHREQGQGEDTHHDSEEQHIQQNLEKLRI